MDVLQASWWHKATSVLCHVISACSATVNRRRMWSIQQHCTQYVEHIATLYAGEWWRLCICNARAAEPVPASCLQPPSSSHMNAVSLHAYSGSCSPDEGHAQMTPSSYHIASLGDSRWYGVAMVTQTSPADPRQRCVPVHCAALCKFIRT